MAISKRKLAANRANAKKSTGPRTQAGREAISQNRTTHGLCGKFLVRPTESQADYDELLESFMEAEKPVDAVERELVAKMARHTWLSQRANNLQEACFNWLPPTEEQKTRGAKTITVRSDLPNYLRYQAHHDRAYQRAANELAKRRKDRDLLARGFESQKRAAAEEKRREERHFQRSEMHDYKVITVKARARREFAASAAANATALASQNSSDGRKTAA